MGRHKKNFKTYNARYSYSDQHPRFREQQSRPISEQVSGSHVSDNNPDADKNDIPGFYFDPEANTYFRLTPENSKHFEEKRIKNQCKKSVPSGRDLKPCGRDLKPCGRNGRKTDGSLTFEIVCREYQNLSSSVFQNNILCARLKIMKEVNRSRFFSEEISPEYCQIMVGNPARGSVIGAWKTAHSTVVYNHQVKSTLEESSNLQEQSPIVNLHFQNVVTDMCVAKLRDGLEFVLYVGNSIRPRSYQHDIRNSMHLYPIRQLCDLSVPENRLSIDSAILNIEHSESTLWSCAWNRHTLGLAFGSEGRVLHMILGANPNTWHKYLSLPKENAFSVEFNESGSLVYCGVNKGYLKCFDLRTQKVVSNIKLTRGLSSLKLLSSEEHIIASCYDHKLLQVDLRAQKVVVEYSGHNNEHLKLPVSVSEKHNFVCSVGQDKFTRIWDLKHGNIVSVIPPVSDMYHPFAWFSEDWQFGSGTETALVLNVGDEFITYKP